MPANLTLITPIANQLSNILTCMRLPAEQRPQHPRRMPPPFRTDNEALTREV